MMNFDLEEQLVRSDVTSGEAEARQRALTVAEFSLSEKEKVLSLSLLPLSLPFFLSFCIIQNFKHLGLLILLHKAQ